jgi:hypothetical protein
VNKTSFKLIGLASALLCGTLSVGNATAVPLLQLYIEGATRDASGGGWYIPGHNFRMWAIGNLTGPGGTNGLPITDVRLAVVYDNPGTEVTITFTPVQIGVNGQYGGFTDPSIPLPPGPLSTVADGSTPVIGDNRRLPSHGQYGPGRTWQEFALGDFTLPDSQLADFVNLFPTPGTGYAAQINAYDVHVNGADAHFDLYGQVTDARGRISYVFAPPGHDATDGPVTVPLPATLALLGIGLLALGACRGRSAPV